MINKQIKKEFAYKIIIIFSIIITIITIIISKLTTTEGIILNKNLTCNFREEVYVKDFISKLDGHIIDNYLVDTSAVGFKDIIVTYKNKYGFIVGKKFTIEIKDVTPPVIVVNNPYIVEVDSIDNLVDNIFCADDFDDNPNCTINGNYNLNEVGEYHIEITATDKSANSTSKYFTLNIVSKQNTNNKPAITSTSFKNIYQKYKKENNLIGLDISKWQGKVDYQELKKQGVEFVMLKIGGQTKIKDDFNLDPNFYKNIEGFIKNNIDVGLYFYSYATSEEEAIKQADWVISKLKNYNITLPIAFDWENWHNYTKFHLSFNSLNKIASSFINRVEEYGYQGILYSSKYYLENIWYEEEYDNWVAYYNEEYREYSNYYMWQLCSDGKIDGIDGYVDIDIMPNK